MGITVQIQDPTKVSVRLREQNLTTAQTNTFNTSIVERVADIGDVDASTLVNGSVLVYRTTTNKWTSTTTLDAQNVDGGEF